MTIHLKDNLKKNFKKAFSLVELSVVIIIIGILIAGITQASGLFREFRLNSARQLTQNSPVPRVKDLVVWLESTTEKSFDDNQRLDNSNVSKWNDINPISVVKYNATSPSSGENPKYISNGINGLPSILSDGINDVMLLNNLTDSFENTGFTWIGVINWLKLPSPPSPPRGYFGLKSDYGIGNGNVTLFLDHDNAGAQFRVISRTDGTLGSNGGIVTAPFKSYDPHIITIVRKTNSLTNYDNGAQIGPSLSDSHVNGIFKTTSPWAIFKYTNTNTLYFYGYAGEYIIYNRPILDSERKNIEQYLSKKWAIKISN